MSSVRRIAAGACLALGVLVAAHALPAVSAQGSGQAARAPVPQSLYAGLRWRMIGPFRGGRVNAVSGVPGQPNTFYFGSVGGGLWKSTNAGRTWMPVFDSQPVASIGAIGVAPSNPNIVYVGTGESDMRDSIAYGDGMYKSTDAGSTWKHIGLDATRQIGRVVVDPKNPDIVFVAALGHAYGPSPDRGVYRSADGGTTWQKVLYKDENVGAVDLAFDPANSQVVYAALWATRRPPWYVYGPSNGPGGGIFKSTDGGLHWQPLTTGLPAEGLGRIGVAVAPANPRRVYAIVDAKDGGLYRSEDAGGRWRRVTPGFPFRGKSLDNILVDARGRVFVGYWDVAGDGGGLELTDAAAGGDGGEEVHGESPEGETGEGITERTRNRKRGRERRKRRRRVRTDNSSGRRMRSMESKQTWKSRENGWRW